MLHNYFSKSNIIGEWFDLNDEEIDNFINICNNKNKIIISLKDNPFYFKENKNEQEL